MPYKKGALIGTAIGHGVITGAITANVLPVLSFNQAGMILAVNNAICVCSLHSGPQTVTASSTVSFNRTGPALVRADDIVSCGATVDMLTCDQALNVE